MALETASKGEGVPGFRQRCGDFAAPALFTSSAWLSAGTARSSHPYPPRSTLPMSNRFKTAIIDDVTSRNIDNRLQDPLLDLFESAMKSVATTLVREAKFDTTDFATAKKRGCDGFTLLMSRTRADSRDGWFGAFQRGDERLDVIGHLE